MEDASIWRAISLVSQDVLSRVVALWGIVGQIDSEILAQLCSSKQIFDFDPNLAGYEM